MAGPDQEDRIRQRAHELWEQEGRPTGAEERHWMQAVAEIDASKPTVAKKPKTAKAPKAAIKPVASGKAASKASKPTARK